MIFKNRRFSYLILLGTASTFVVGCASLDGAPQRIIPTEYSVSLVKKDGAYSFAKALIEFNKKKAQPADQKNYRDLVVAIYLNAVDARYFDFRTQLASQGRGSNIGFDLAVLGLTSGASIAKESIVNELSAAAAVFAGSKSIINKSLYFDKTLPAILTAMDTERLKVRKQIVDNSRSTAAQYPLAAAFADISAYEMAGSLDRAIGTITSSAASDRQEANEEYDKAIERAKTGCISTADIGTASRKINKVLFDLLEGKGDYVALDDEAKKKAKIVAINKNLDTKTNAEDSVQDQIFSLQDQFRTKAYCTETDINSLLEKIKIVDGAA